jgi:outer membrane biosynthesis protein TonB
MKTTREQKKGILGTVIFHLALLLLFYFLALHTPLPLPGEGGVEIEMGSAEGSLDETSAATASEQVTSVSNQEQPDIITQTSEETTVIQSGNNRRQRQEQPVEIVAPPIETTPVVNSRAIYSGSNRTEPSTNGDGNQNGSGNGTSGDGGNGNGQGSGNGQGIGNGTGHGNGQGSDYFLSGREVKVLKKPAYTSKEQGRVVVEITVDKNGNVLTARAGAKVQNSNIGTTTSDATLWQQSEEAALQSKFSHNNNAAAKQKGYIVYNFIKQGE